MKRSLLLCVLLLAAGAMAVRKHAAPPPRDVLPDLKHERVDYWVDQFSHTPEYRKKIAAALERKPRARGMPQNLIYLAMEESAFDPAAHSSEDAVGIWQLTGDTARLYGLRVNKKVDERKNLEKETDAALEFLSDLYDRFGCWYLAAAAYNGGQNRIGRIMIEAKGTQRGTDRDYYRIWDKLPAETRDFVPAIIALKRIGRNPAQHGF